MVCIREGLNAAVVRNSNGGHTPFFRPLDDALYLRNTIHIAHFCMAVQFHTFFQAVVHTLGGKVIGLFNTYNRA